MLSINFPEPSFRMKKENNRQMLFDPLRKRWLLLTPEEWVRQNFIQYLVKEQRYPAAFIAQEKGILLGELKKRFDILIYDHRHEPWMIVECKASTIPLDEAVLQQALRYNLGVPVPFLIITNGHYSRGWHKTGSALEELEVMPSWPGNGKTINDL